MRELKFHFELDPKEKNRGKQLDASRELFAVCFDACAECYSVEITIGALAAVIAERAQGQDDVCGAIQQFHKILDTTHELFSHAKSAAKYGPQ